MVFHLWMRYSDIHGRQWFIAVTWLICLSAWDAQGSEKLRCAGLLTFQILFSPANGRLTSGVSAVAGNWHAWLLPPADWKLNMSFVSQGWAFIQSWLGIHSNASWGFDFMHKRSWTHLAGIAVVTCWCLKHCSSLQFVKRSLKSSVSDFPSFDTHC